MGIAVFPVPVAASGGAASDNWVLISSVTPTNFATSVTFSSISGYKKLMLRWFDTSNIGAASTLSIRLNSDSNTRYSYGYTSYTGTSLGGADAHANATSFGGFVQNTNTGTNYGVIKIIDTDTTNAKSVSGFSEGVNAGTTFTIPEYEGVYYGTAAVTSVSLISNDTNGFQATGTIALYGVAV